MLIIHNDIIISDMENSLAFYCNQIGFEIIEDYNLHGKLPQYVSKGHAETMRLVLLKCSKIGGALELLCFPKGEYEVKPNQGNISLLVPDINNLVEKLSEKGLQPCSEVFDLEFPSIGRSRIIFYKDPDGHQIEFVEKIRN